MSESVDPHTRYIEAVLERAAADLGRPVPQGTTVVGAAAREGSTNAVVYPLGDRTIVWCAPTLCDQLTSLNGPDPLTLDETVTALERLGGSFVGGGNHRVLRQDPRIDAVDGYRLVELDRDVADDRSLLADFVDACSEDDLDEAELEMDDLDPAIVALVDNTGAIASYASARPWEIASDFDDIAVITHPDHRRRGLGAVGVGEFAARRRAEGRALLYSCDVENAASNATSERVGFELVCSVAAVSLP